MIDDEWISVEDRLPEDGTTVLITIRFPNGNRLVREVLYHRNKFCGEAQEEVTHWCPLPAPAMSQR